MQQPTDDEPRCGRPTKSGRPCRNRVDRPGKPCRMHMKAALLERLLGGGDTDQRAESDDADDGLERGPVGAD